MTFTTALLKVGLMYASQHDNKGLYIRSEEN